MNNLLSSSQLLSTQKKNNDHKIVSNINDYQQINSTIIKEVKLGLNNNSNYDLKAFRINIENLKNTFSIFYFEFLNNNVNNNNFLNQTCLENLKGKIYFKSNNIISYLKINMPVQEVLLCDINNKLQATIFELEYCQDSKGFYIRIFNNLKDFCYLIINKDGQINILNRDTLQLGYIFRNRREIHQFIIN